jgi:hypothetical protein
MEINGGIAVWLVLDLPGFIPTFGVKRVVREREGILLPVEICLFGINGPYGFDALEPLDIGEQGIAWDWLSERVDIGLSTPGGVELVCGKNQSACQETYA